MATKREEIENGNWDKIPDDEPIFILRAQDATAGRMVEAWAQHARGLGVNKQKCDDASALVYQMMAWPNRKLPD